MERTPPAPFFTKVRPSPRLAPFVGAFHLFSADDLGGARVEARHFATGTTNLQLSFADAPRLATDSRALGVAAILGPIPRADVLVFAGRVDFIDVNFRPGGVAALFALPLTHLAGRVVGLDDAWGPWALRMAEELEGIPPRKRVPHLERLLLRQLDEGRRVRPAIREAVRRIERSNGQVRVGPLAEAVNLSVSQLERGFASDVGLSPKRLARLVRCYDVVQRIRGANDHDWAEIALRGGYADQAHFARELRELTGLSPTGFTSIRPNADFLQD